MLETGHNILNTITTVKPTTSRKPRKKEIINEIPFGTKRKVNKNKRRKVVKRVKKKNSKRWRQKQNSRDTTTKKPESKKFWNSGRDRVKTKSKEKLNKHLQKQKEREQRRLQEQEREQKRQH